MIKSAFKTTTFWYKFKWNLNSYSQTLTLLFITYTIYPSNVPVLLRSHQLRSLWATLRNTIYYYTIYPFNVPFLCWHQLRSVWATLQYQCDHLLQPWRVGCSSKYREEKQWESTVIHKLHFLFLNDHPKDIWLNLLLRRLHSDTNLNEI